MNRAARLWRPAVLLVSLFCFACVSLERSFPDKRYFVIELNSAMDGNPGGSEILSVSTLHISPRYADLGFVYRTSDAEYEADFYNQFLSSPAVMISEETRKALAASNKFKFVVGPTSSLTANYTLEGSINSLYGDFRKLNTPAAVLEIELFLHNEDPGSPGIVLQKRYMKSVPLKERSPEALVRGWNEALEGVVAMFVADFAALKL
ncbi:MAG TPA: ABC-type transport auxiliary lipoprotein family protein [Candidatus Binatia bacterium]|nr:ABC-type transport auxiliary lipoprotein family protein [Candidatus Binatia bacterium]